MEIKTCEDYVVNELLTTKDELETAKDTISNLTNRYNVLLDNFMFVKSFICLEKTHANDDYFISFDKQWKSYDSANYDRLVCIFDLNESDLDDIEDE